MDYARVFAVSAAGMSLERARVDTAAANLAQANTVQDPSAPAYRPVQAVARTNAAQAFGEIVNGELPAVVPSVQMEPQAVAPRVAHEPGHPFADARGFVTYPGVDPVHEMVTLMAALRAYEANLAALGTARTLALRTLDIGRGT